MNTPCSRPELWSGETYLLPLPPTSCVTLGECHVPLSPGCLLWGITHDLPAGRWWAMHGEHLRGLSCDCATWLWRHLLPPGIASSSRGTSQRLCTSEKGGPFRTRLRWARACAETFRRSTMLRNHSPRPRSPNI